MNQAASLLFGLLGVTFAVGIAGCALVAAITLVEDIQTIFTTTERDSAAKVLKWPEDLTARNSHR